MDDKLPGTSVPAGDAPAANRSRAVRPGRLPISELAFDRPAAPSPFGDDVAFPLPVERLRYTHTTAEALGEIAVGSNGAGS